MCWCTVKKLPVLTHSTWLQHVECWSTQYTIFNIWHCLYVRTHRLRAVQQVKSKMTAHEYVIKLTTFRASSTAVTRMLMTSCWCWWLSQQLYGNYSGVGNVFQWGPLNYTCPLTSTTEWSATIRLHCFTLPVYDCICMQPRTNQTKSVC